MTPIDYTALAERLKAHAECHSNVEPFDDEQRQWADDLRTVVSLLRGMAHREAVRLTHPAPQPQPIDQHMIAAEDRFPDEPTEAQIELPPLPEFPGASTPVLREALQSIARDYARAVERAAYEAAIKACENEKRISARTFDDDIHDEACEACADSIRSLMQEQPK